MIKKRILNFKGTEDFNEVHRMKSGAYFGELAIIEN